MGVLCTKTGHQMISFDITRSCMHVKCKTILLDEEVEYLEVYVPRYVLAFLIRLYSYCQNMCSFKEMLYRIIEDLDGKPYNEWDGEIREIVPERWSASFLEWLDEVCMRLEFAMPMQTI